MSLKRQITLVLIVIGALMPMLPAERTTTSTREISGMVDAINNRATEAVR